MTAVVDPIRVDEQVDEANGAALAQCVLCPTGPVVFHEDPDVARALLGKHIRSVHGVEPWPTATASPSGEEVRKWVTERYGDGGWFMVASKLAAEAGEVLDAAIKLVERRTDADWLDEVRAELGDVGIVARSLAYEHGWDFDEVIADRWRQVVARGGPGGRTDGEPRFVAPEPLDDGGPRWTAPAPIGVRP